MPKVKGFSLIGYAMAGFLILGLLGVKAQAQSQNPPAASKKKVRPSEVQDVTLRLSGQSCDKHIVDVESALLHLREGVTMVDIEKRKGHLFVGYDPANVSIDQMLSTVAKQSGEDWFCQAQVVVE